MSRGWRFYIGPALFAMFGSWVFAEWGRWALGWPDAQGWIMQQAVYWLLVLLLMEAKRDLDSPEVG